ncbi:9756_t:CDS:1, partial [Funneliformis caledonium]
EYSNEILTIESQSKRRKTIDTKRRTTKNETAILYALKVYKNNLSDDAVASVCERLSEVWIVKKVRE